jgi:hypothetical protein
MAGPAYAQSSPDADLRNVFDEILRDPGNAGLNLRYARLAIAQGDLRKALAAYERILAVDPNNEDAKAGLRNVRLQLEPSLTRFTLLTGAQFESNARRVDAQNWHTHDATMFLRGNVDDERTIGPYRWRSSGELYANYHPRFHDIDYGIVGGNTGPVFDFGDNLHIHPFVGAAYSWIERRTFYGEASAGATFEFDILGPLRDIQVRWGYDSVGRTFSTRDATFVEVSPRFQFSNVLFDKTILILVPYWRYNGVFGHGPPGIDPRSEPFPSRSHQLGIRADYFVQFASWLAADFIFNYEHRHYYEDVTDQSKHRRDDYFSPAVQLIVPGLFRGRADLIFNYSYEYRSTNDGPQRYQDHIAGVRLLWRF